MTQLQLDLIEQRHESRYYASIYDCDGEYIGGELGADIADLLDEVKRLKTYLSKLNGALK